MKNVVTSLDSCLFDTHCHFDFDDFGDEEQRQSIWASCKQKGIQRLLIPGVSPQQWDQSFRITQLLPGILMGVGVHPWWLKDVSHRILTDGHLEQMHSLLNRSACVAVGECGLDAMIGLTVKEQTPAFEQQLALACELDMPLIVHVRKTHNETLALLKRYQSSAGGVIHGFTGSAELAQQYWGLGFYLGIGGSITYPRANKTRQAVQAMPLESLLLETDAPDMPLNGFQGQINTPLKVLKVAEALSGLKELPLDLVCNTTTENAYRLFAL
ncbi:MAG: TatD family hydrolase [Cellvibrionaceae bacterium]